MNESGESLPSGEPERYEHTGRTPVKACCSFRCMC
jgi:hypothetical protein